MIPVTIFCFFPKGARTRCPGKILPRRGKWDEISEGFIDGEVKKKVDVGMEV